MSGHHHFSRLRSEVLARPGAAVFAFRDCDALSYDMVPAVRSYTVVDPNLRRGHVRRGATNRRCRRDRWLRGPILGVRSAGLELPEQAVVLFVCSSLQ